MTYRGMVLKGVVVLEGNVRLPEGNSVFVETAPQSSVAPTEDKLFEMSDLVVDTGIPDLATNIDHYLYGHPKVKDAN